MSWGSEHSWISCFKFQPLLGDLDVLAIQPRAFFVPLSSPLIPSLASPLCLDFWSFVSVTVLKILPVPLLLGPPSTSLKTAAGSDEPGL